MTKVHVILLLVGVGTTLFLSCGVSAADAECGEKEVALARLDPAIVTAATKRMPDFRLEKASTVNVPPHLELEGTSNRAPVEIKITHSGEVLCVEFEDYD